MLTHRPYPCAKIAQQLISQNLIDRYHIAIIPTILGSGTPLFSSCEQEIQLQLIDTKNSNGITELIYQKRAILA